MPTTKPCANATPSGAQPLTLTIRGLGAVPSFKNMKRVHSKGLFTEPRAKKWMQACEDSFALQLLLEFRARGGATQTGRSRQFWIATVGPLDDCIQEIPEIHVKVQWVEPGWEGADVMIEPI